MSNESGTIIPFPKRAVSEDPFRIKPAENPAADPALIACLEDALERAKKAEITGCVLLSWFPDGPGFLRWISMPASEPHVDVAAFRFKGGLGLLEEDLAALAHTKYAPFEELREEEPS